MNIVLTGFMGTGKTAVGRRLAEKLQAPFLDADTEIQRKAAGRTIGDIFSADGEAAFRALESQVIEELSAHDRTVIATGGGALLNPQNRQLLGKHGLLICLTARTGTLLERLKDDLTRPLLAGENVPEKLERLMKERESVYAECSLQVATDGKTIAAVADEIIERVLPEWNRK